MRIFRPAGVPTWFDAVIRSIERGMGEVWSSSLRLLGLATADLPDPAENKQGLIFDLTLGQPVYSDGNGWLTFSPTTHVHAAADVTFPPTGGIAATNVQAAIVELDTEKLSSVNNNNWLGADLEITNGGTGASTAAAARTNLSLLSTAENDLRYAARASNLSDLDNVATARSNLGLVIGTNVQAYSANLTAWAGIAPATGVGTFLATPSSANLLTALTTKTGTGNAVFSSSPTFTGTLTAAAVTLSSGIARSAHNVGHLVGSFNNVGDNSAKTNPIYTIGSGFNPTETALSSMYGVGYTDANNAQAGATFLAGLTAGAGSQYGMYVAAAGVATIFLNASSGDIRATGGATFGAPVKPGGYTVAGAPAAGAYAGHMIYVSNESGGPVLAFSDGAVWRRVTDRAVIS